MSIVWQINKFILTVMHITASLNFTQVINRYYPRYLITKPTVTTKIRSTLNLNVCIYNIIEVSNYVKLTN